jgi:hypothetical protein
MARGEDRGLEHGWMAHEGVLHRDARDPLAAGLDDVLLPIRDRHVALTVDLHHVAGPEPPVCGETIAADVAEVRRGDERAADLELAHLLSIPGEDIPRVVDVPRLDERHGEALRRAHGKLGLRAAAEMRLDPRERTEWVGLRYPRS